MECTTASASLSIDLYVAGFSISAFSHETDDDHDGFSGVEVTEDHTGSPDLLIDVTSQPLPAAALHIREPVNKRKGKRKKELVAIHNRWLSLLGGK